MITFAIPLRSKSASNDWGKVSALFNRTLASICGQTNGDFRVVVACHDVPELLPGLPLEKIEFMQVDSPLPRDYHEQMLDKGWKVHACAKWMREQGGGYSMLVDSDDLVSNRIAEYCAANPCCSGFVSSYGWHYAEGAHTVRKMRRMYRTCGSCTIVNWSVDDLPGSMPRDFYKQAADAAPYLIRSSHRFMPNKLAEVGRPLERLPFASTVYVQGAGENHSILSGNTLSWKRRVELLAQVPRSVDSISSEFGLRSLSEFVVD